MRRGAPSWSERVYATLVRFVYPASFRDRFGEELRDFFRDRYCDARTSRGAFAVPALWGRIVPDLIVSGVRERLDAFAARRAAVPAAPPDDPFPHRTVSLPHAILSDARYALRTFRKNPVFVAVAVLVVSLGTGAVSTIFSVANAIVLRPIPAVRDASGIVEVGRTRPGSGGTLTASYPYYRYVADRTKGLEGLAAWSMMALTVNTGGQGVSGLGNAVSGNYFGVLGVRPALGAFFSGDDVSLAREQVAVISHGFWQRQLGGDSSVIGRTIRVNGEPRVVLGVTPPRFTGVYPALRTDVWLPLAHRTQLRGQGDMGFDDARSAWMQLVGRLAGGGSPEVAQRELSTLTARYVTAAGDAEPKGMTEYTSARVDGVAGVPAEVSGAVAGFLGVLLAIAALVLMIASVNVASMLLARAVVRRREMAMRMALGASRRRIVRQLLVESLLLFGAGGAVGTLVAVWGTRLMQRIELPIDVPLELDATPDARVLLVTIAVSLLTGIVFGLAPAFQGTRLDVQGILRSDSAGAGRRRSRLRDGLIVGQIAMSLLLLSSAGLFVRALGRGQATDPGFTVDGVVTTALDLESAGYEEARARTLLRNLSDRMATVPGVEAVAYGRVLPLSMNTSGYGISIPGHAPPGGKAGDEFSVDANVIDEGYLDALRIPLLRGRDFARTDDMAAPRVAIVNERFVRRYFPNGEGLGATFRMDSSLVTIVGVARDARFTRLDEEPTPFLFLPNAQEWRSAGNLLIRTTGAPEAASAALLREMATLDPSLPSPRITTMRQATAVVLLPQRVAAAVTGALGLVGLLLAAVGLYGVLAFSTAQRTREIGVRLALGASRGGIMRLVLGDGVRLVAAGVGVGLFLAFLATRALRPFLFGVNPMDPLTFLAMSATLGGVAMLATWLPARRAARVDPMRSMREE